MSNGLLELDVRSPSIARSLDRSMARSLDRSIARSPDRQVVRSFGRSVARSFDRSIAPSIARSLAIITVHVRNMIIEHMSCLAWLVFGALRDERFYFASFKSFRHAADQTTFWVFPNFSEVPTSQVFLCRSV